MIDTLFLLAYLCANKIILRRKYWSNTCCLLRTGNLRGTSGKHKVLLKKDLVLWPTEKKKR